MPKPTDPNSKTQIDPDRLLNAADTLLKALAHDPKGFALVDVCMCDEGALPADGFTADELVEGMRFLIRAGLAVPREASRVGSARARSNRRDYQ